MLSFLKKKATENLKACVSGEAIKIEDVNDGVFSEKMLGDGMAIIPEDEVVIAPCNGSVCAVTDTKHAVGLQLDNGMQLLIHIGLDTVSMQGKGFQVHVKEGQKIKESQPLITFSKSLIKEAGFKDTVIIVIVENNNNIPLNFQYGVVEKGKSVIVNF